MKCLIYKATNKVNGKSYIGFTTVSLEKRKMHHERHYTKTGSIFPKAIKKYGTDNFDWEILYQSNDEDFTQNIMEGYFIKLHKTHISENGYNMTLGGEGCVGNPRTKEHRQKISKKTKQFWNSESGQKKRKRAQASRVGKTLSEETKQKISEKHKGKKLSEKHKRAITKGLQNNKTMSHGEVPIKITYEDNKTQYFRSQKEFSLESGINVGVIRQILNKPSNYSVKHKIRIEKC